MIMSTTTVFGRADAYGHSVPRTTFLERLFAARMAHAERAVRPYLAQQSDERLSTLGFSPSEIRAIRAGGNAAPACRL